MDIDFELQKYDVSRETIQKMKDFAELLRDWNTKMNLVSKNSMENVWERHIFDSLQLADYLPKNTEYLVDIGSGAGFPGVVLAIYMQEKIPAAKVTLVESITKKTVYLNDACSKLDLKNVKIENNRVENIVFKHVDVITARAVASLDVLFGYASKIVGNDTKMLFLKGRSYTEEENTAKQKWRYTAITHPNKYDDSGVVMEIHKLRKVK